MGSTSRRVKRSPYGAESWPSVFSSPPALPRWAVCATAARPSARVGSAAGDEAGWVYEATGGSGCRRWSIPAMPSCGGSCAMGRSRGASGVSDGRPGWRRRDFAARRLPPLGGRRSPLPRHHWCVRPSMRYDHSTMTAGPVGARSSAQGGKVSPADECVQLLDVALWPNVRR